MRGVADVPPEPPAGDLGDRRHVVGAAVAGRLPDGVVPVVGLARQPVLEHHQRGHHIGALDMADVDALDPQWRSRPGRVNLEYSAAQHDLALKSPARFSLCCCSASWALRCTVSARAFLSPRRGTRSTTRDPRSPDSHSATSSALGGRHGTSTSRGTGFDGLVGGTTQFGLLAVELGEELLDQLRLHGITGIAGPRLFDDPAALAAHPAAADVEHLDGGFEVVVGERHHIGVGAVTEHHGLLLQGPAQRRQIVTQPGGTLEVELPRPQRSSGVPVRGRSGRSCRTGNRRSPRRSCDAPRR